MEETLIKKDLDLIRVLHIDVKDYANAYDVGMILKIIEELYSITILHNRNIVIPFQKEDYHNNRDYIIEGLINSLNIKEGEPLYKLLRQEITLSNYIESISDKDEFNRFRALSILGHVRSRIHDELFSIYRQPIDLEIVKNIAKPISEMTLKEILQTTSIVFPEYAQLSIKSIEFNSPGKIDLLGIGAVFQHVKDLVIFIIENHQNKEKRKLELLLKREELNRKRLENITMIIGATTKFNLKDDEYQNMRNLLIESLSEFPRELITDIKINPVKELE